MTPVQSVASDLRVAVIDTHTAGEPTRVVLAGGPDLGTGPLAERRSLFRERFDPFRSAVVNEPRGSDVMVGALLCEGLDPRSSAGVIFFNNVGVLNMCGHGAMGVAVALGHLGRIGPGEHRLETPAGPVCFELHDRRRVTLENVPGFRHRAQVTLEVDGIGPVTGDVAWGGNWFFLVSEHVEPIALENVERLSAQAWRIRQALVREGITGADGAEIDHVELAGPPHDPRNHSRNFVLCPGRAYDRSPCGTGTSARLACLVSDGTLKPGEVYRQESVIGSLFEGTVRIENGHIIPRITGTAFVTAESTLILSADDPFRYGIGQRI